MQSDLEVSRALGWYRAPWYMLVPATTIGGVGIYVQIGNMIRHFEGVQLLDSILWAIFLAAVWFIPQTVVTRAGIRLVWRLRFIPWCDIDRVYQAGPGDPDIRVGLLGAKPLSIPGLKQDRLPGIVILARRGAGQARL